MKAVFPILSSLLFELKQLHQLSFERRTSTGNCILRQWFCPQFFGFTVFITVKLIHLQIGKRQGISKGERPHFRLTCFAQDENAFCLKFSIVSSLNTTSDCTKHLAKEKTNSSIQFTRVHLNFPKKSQLEQLILQCTSYPSREIIFTFVNFSFLGLLCIDLLYKPCFRVKNQTLETINQLADIINGLYKAPVKCSFMCSDTAQFACCSVLTDSQSKWSLQRTKYNEKISQGLL